MGPWFSPVALGLVLLVATSSPAEARSPHAAPLHRSAARRAAPTHTVREAQAQHDWTHIWRRHTVAPSSIRVHDGDTFYTGGEAIRLRGIDTPELGRPKSRLATSRLLRLLREGPVTIVPRAEDVYGRTVADVFVHGRDVAAELRREGFEKPEAESAHTGW